MKRIVLIVFTLVAILAFHSTAFAKNIQFTAWKGDLATYVDTNTKDLSGSQWKISNQQKAPSDFIQDQDVVGFKVWNPGCTTAYSGYHTFSKFVDKYSLPYSTTPAMNTTLRLNAQIDSSSAHSHATFVGEWIS